VFVIVVITGGDKLDELSTSITISPDQTKDATFYHTAIGTDVEKRDVEIEVYVAGTLIVQDEWDDIYYVSGGPPAGSITSTMISKSPEGSKIPLPTTVAADGNTFEVRVQAKNTSAATFTAGVEIKVRDPNNVLRKTISPNYTGMSPGEELAWGNYNICSVDKAGAWKVNVRFLVNDGTVLDEKTFTMTATAEEYVDFRMNINGSAAGWVFPGANRWMCFYYDPKKGDFVGDNEWHFLFWRADFDNVFPGGYIAVFFSNTSTGETSPKYTSPTWDIIDGHTYEYNPSYNTIT